MNEEKSGGVISFAAWNVNSVRARLEHLTEYLREVSPDILCLQELKCTDDQFPREAVEDAGYNVVLYGQKTYNGVAILSKAPVCDVIRGIPGFEDEQARYVECTAETGAGVFRVASVYVPNGASPDAPAFEYKMRFLDALTDHWRRLMESGERLAAGGDFNAVFDPVLDCADPHHVEGALCCTPAERAKMRLLAASGLTDAFRMFHEAERSFTWRDYRDRDPAGGLRIDYVFAGTKASDTLTDCVHDSVWRLKEKPSDHTPVRAFFAADACTAEALRSARSTSEHAET